MQHDTTATRNPEIWRPIPNTACKEPNGRLEIGANSKREEGGVLTALRSDCAHRLTPDRLQTPYSAQPASGRPLRTSGRCSPVASAGVLEAASAVKGSRTRAASALTLGASPTSATAAWRPQRSIYAPKAQDADRVMLSPAPRPASGPCRFRKNVVQFTADAKGCC
jgi:hypothetical protein